MRGSPPASSAWPSVSSSSSRGAPASTGTGGTQEARRILGRTLITLGDGFAGGEAGRIGVGRRDPGRVGLEPETLEGRADLAGPRRARGRPSSSPRAHSLLIRLISVSQSRAAASSWSGLVAAADGGSEAALGRVLGLVDGARVGSPGRRDRRRLVLVVAPLGEAQGVDRGVRLGCGRGSRARSARRRGVAPRRIGPWRQRRPTANRSGRPGRASASGARGDRPPSRPRRLRPPSPSRASAPGPVRLAGPESRRESLPRGGRVAPSPAQPRSAGRRGSGRHRPRSGSRPVVPRGPWSAPAGCR